MKAARTGIWWTIVLTLVAVIGFSVASAILAAPLAGISAATPGPVVGVATVPVAIPGAAGLGAVSSPLVLVSTGVVVSTGSSSAASAAPTSTPSAAS